MSSAAIVAVAARQHGHVSARQLGELGFSRDAIATRVRAGWLVPALRGTYRLAGAEVTFAGRCAAAVLAVDPAAVLIHRSGLVLHGLLEPAPAAPIHLACARAHRARPGVVVHQRKPRPQETVRIDGLRVAPVERCLVDLAAAAPVATVEAAVHEAEFQRVLDPSALREAAFGHPGAELLQRLAADRLPVQGELRTELERCFAAFLLRHGFPVASVNHELLLRDPRQRVVLDAVWFQVGLAVELDGRQAHATARAFDADRERDRRLAVQYGLQVVRATWRHLHEHEERLAADLWALHRNPMRIPRSSG